MSNKKREILPLPANLTPDRLVCFCIAIPDDPQHFAAFWGALSYLQMRYAWGKPLTTDSETIASYWGNIIADNRINFEKALGMANNGCGCDEPDAKRITDGGISEVSFDDGVSWEPDPDDGRFFGTIFPPPPTPPGDSRRCNSAAAARQIIETISNELLTSADFLTAVNTATAVLCQILVTVFNLEGAATCVIVSGAIAALVQLGRFAISLALADEVWNRLECNFYCNMRPDGSFSTLGWQQAKTQLISDESGAAEAWLFTILNALGPIGLTNAAWSNHGVVGDCSGCDCPDACTNDMVIGDCNGDWSTASGTLVQNPDLTWTATAETVSVGIYNARITIQFNEACSACCYVVGVEQLNGGTVISEWHDCDDNYGSGGVNVPAGCYKSIDFLSQFGLFQVKIATADCP